jgi:hypothetical protein
MFQVVVSIRLTPENFRWLSENSGQSEDVVELSLVPPKKTSLLGRLRHNTPSAAHVNWPNPREASGEYRGRFGNQDLWEMKGPGVAKLDSLLADLRALLTAQRAHLLVEETVPSCLYLSTFMIGRHKTTSSPIVVVISPNKKFLLRAVDTIRNSKMVDNYEGVLLGSTSMPLFRFPDSRPVYSIASDPEDGPSISPLVVPNPKVAEPSHVLPPPTTGISTASGSLFDKDRLTSAYTPDKHDNSTAMTSIDTHPVGYKEEQEFGDRVSIYTRSTIPGGREYMTDLANDLFGKVFSELPDLETLDRVSDSLPNLLRGFALKLAGENQAPINREIMAFVHKKRR